MASPAWVRRADGDDDPIRAPRPVSALRALRFLRRRDAWCAGDGGPGRRDCRSGDPSGFEAGQDPAAPASRPEGMTLAPGPAHIPCHLAGRRAAGGGGRPAGGTRRIRLKRTQQRPDTETDAPILVRAGVAYAGPICAVPPAQRLQPDRVQVHPGGSGCCIGLVVRRWLIAHGFLPRAARGAPLRYRRRGRSVLEVYERCEPDAASSTSFVSWPGVSSQQAGRFCGTAYWGAGNNGPVSTAKASSFLNCPGGAVARGR